MDPFWNISYNLLALYDATRYSSSKNEVGPYANLIPNLTGWNENRNVNFSPSGFWVTILHWPLYKQECLRRIQNALEDTHTLFHRYQKNLVKVLLPTYEEYLNGKILNKDIDQVAYKKTEEDIQEFYYYTDYFFKAVQSHEIDRLTQLFQRHFCSHCFDHIPQLEAYHAIIALKGELGDEIPLKSLKEASFGTEDGKREIEQFAFSLASQKVDIRIIHNALKSIVLHTERFHLTEAHKSLNQFPNLATLESALYHHQPSIFRQIDPDQMSWRNTLEEGSIIVSEFYDTEKKALVKYKCLLGKQLGKKENRAELDHNLYFEIKALFKDTEELEKASSDWVVWISINHALCGIKWKQAEECEIKPATIHWIDPQGRFALVDKLQPFPLGSFKQDPTFYTFFSRFIGFLVSEAITLDLLKTENFMLAKHPEEPQQLVITTLKLTRPEDSFSYSKWEQFIFDLSKGDSEMHRWIMEQSSLTKMDEATYIKKAVHAAFKDQFDPQKEALGQSFKDDSIPITAVKLQNELGKLRNHCKQMLNVQHKIAISDENLEKRILEKYEEKGCVTFLWPTLADEIIKSFLSS